MKVHLGVVDIPYAATPEGGPKKGRRRKVSVSLQTTGSIAEILEGKYHIMEHFVALHGGEITAALEDGLAGALETVLIGGSPANDLLSSGEAKIEEVFRRFLENKEMDTLGYPGVPTRAAQMGVNHRLKQKRGPPRPSFIDTGAYSGAMKVWTDNGERS